MRTSSETKPRARRLAWLAAGLALLASCNSYRVQPQPPPPDGVEVRVLLFSGRPDPTFVLPEDALPELSEALAAARENPQFRGSTVIPSRLGYKGFLLRNPFRRGEIPIQVSVYRGDIEIAGEPRRFLTDGGALENWLVERAREAKAIDDSSMEWIRQR
jgi:hypothetical protein